MAAADPKGTEFISWPRSRRQKRRAFQHGRSFRVHSHYASRCLKVPFKCQLQVAKVVAHALPATTGSSVRNDIARYSRHDRGQRACR